MEKLTSAHHPLPRSALWTVDLWVMEPHETRQVGWCLATRNLLPKPSMETLPLLGTLLSAGSEDRKLSSTPHCGPPKSGSYLSECGVGKDSWTQAVKITSFSIKTPLTKYFCSVLRRGPVVSRGGGEGLFSRGLPALAEIKECATTPQTRDSSVRRRISG